MTSTPLKGGGGGAEGEISSLLWRISPPGMSVFYRDILRKQYIASFGNIRKYRDTRGYHDIFTIFFIHDISHFWPFMDQLTIAIH